MNDCPNYQSAVVISFAEFVAKRDFQLVAELHKRILYFTTVDWLDSYKRFARELFVPVWKRLLELRPRSPVVGGHPGENIDLEMLAVNLEEHSNETG
jgi:hypothetical protein